MKKILFISTLSVTLLMMPLSGKPVPEKEKSKNFSTVLTEFRYSLFNDLVSVPSTRLFAEKSPAAEKIARKCEQFYNSRREEIRQHQVSILQQFRETKIDLTGIEKDIHYNSFDSVLRISPWGWDKISSPPKEYQKSDREINILKIALVDPTGHALYLVNFYLARNLPPGEMGQRVFRNSIAALLIKTEKIDAANWKIIIDEFQHVYILHFNLDRNIMKITDIYIRKK